MMDGDKAIRHCLAYALDAERRLGQLLKDTERAKGGNPKLPTGAHALPVEPTLTELGLTKKESSEAQMLASGSAQDERSPEGEGQGEAT